MTAPIGRGLLVGDLNVVRPLDQRLVGYLVNQAETGQPELLLEVILREDVMLFYPLDRPSRWVDLFIDIEKEARMANKSLAAAKAAKNDEFYTQWVDIV